MLGDGKYRIIWRLVELEGGTPRPGDSLRDLLAKYLIAIGGTPVQGDHYLTLLAKVVIIKGGTPLPLDMEWDLLVKWLQAEGECRKCGDSVHNLWRKILDLGESEPAPTAPEVRVQQGATVLIDGSPELFSLGTYCQGGPVLSKVFTVFNDGDAPLLTSGLSVPANFFIGGALAASIPPGGSDTFSIELSSASPEGSHSGTVSFANNDATENPFTFGITAESSNPLFINTATADTDIPWNGSLSWFWPGGDAGCTNEDPEWFGVELNQDGGGFTDVQFVAGALRIHTRASDGNPHTWKFRVAAFDEDLNRVTGWVESEEFLGV